MCTYLGEIIGKYGTPDVFEPLAFQYAFTRKAKKCTLSIIFHVYGYGSTSKSPNFLGLHPISVNSIPPQRLWVYEEWALIWVNHHRIFMGIQVPTVDKTDISDVRIFHDTAFTNSYSPWEFSIPS